MLGCVVMFSVQNAADTQMSLFCVFLKVVMEHTSVEKTLSFNSCQSGEHLTNGLYEAHRVIRSDLAKATEGGTRNFLSL